MLGTRYEEYTHFAENFPFELVKDILITPKTRRRETNWHTNLEIKFCTAGTGEVWLDEKTIPFSEGDIAIINSNVLHYTNSDTSLTYTAIVADNAFCRMVGINPSVITFVSRINDAEFVVLLKKLIAIHQDTSHPLRTAKAYACMLEILIYLCEKYTLSVSEPMVSQSFETVKNSICYIRENYSKKLSLDEIAYAVLTDKFSLSREFKKATNQTVVQYINNFRCQKAADLIASGVPVSEAARQCGFSNMSFFTKTFRSHMHTLPSRYKPK